MAIGTAVNPGSLQGKDPPRLSGNLGSVVDSCKIGL
ncbi:hypothetical protein cgR_0085 [Corynebacterium glutamicum R]|uniref:Uncharacterized protein n=1 Tax=Corynebacterium glutamicum (strain R) TaxID=340322 RepID=A0AB72V7C0_CORGB|nr:hypothetical protein cgR_0085 [Corynebacterium glutamicum R]